MKASVCIPVYNAESTIERLVNELLRVFAGNEVIEALEIVLVNDASRDATEAICTRLAQDIPEVKFISLRRNYGEHNAVMCALSYSTGDCVVIMDDDFQNPPAEAVRLAEEITKGFDVVYGDFHQKQHASFRNFGSWLNGKIANRLLNKPKDLYLSSFKSINRAVCDEILKYKGAFPYVDGLLLRVTNNIGKISVRHDERAHGRSGYTLKKLISLWLNTFINFSVKPLRVFSAFGVLLALLGFAGAIYTIIEKILYPETSSAGWPSLFSALLFLSGVQFIFLGLISEYLGKLYLDQNGQPQWTVKLEVI